ncbi:MAG TPA: glycosyltransferase family 2 protein [Ignavibacteria bacterium]|nr:glycosyltransferase family 2 protein [Ignavibacteria bacterium]
MNKVSIITVTYNAGKFLQETINSIKNQTYKNIEYIIIDGKSKDDTLKIVEENKNVISNFISEKDNGIYDAMNKGLNMATGDYVWFINAGDEIYDDYTLEKTMNLSNDADAFYGDVLYINEEKESLGTRTLKKPPKVLSWKNFINGMVVSHQSIIVKKDLCIGFNPDYKYCADLDWMIGSLKNCNKIINTEMILSKFLIGGFSKENIIPSNKERIKILKKYFSYTEILKSHIDLSFKFAKYYITNKRKLY